VLGSYTEQDDVQVSSGKPLSNNTIVCEATQLFLLKKILKDNDLHPKKNGFDYLNLEICKICEELKDRSIKYMIVTNSTQIPSLSDDR
jgi:hypothetical protein